MTLSPSNETRRLQRLKTKPSLGHIVFTPSRLDFTLIAAYKFKWLWRGEG